MGREPLFGSQSVVLGRQNLIYSSMWVVKYSFDLVSGSPNSKCWEPPSLKIWNIVFLKNRGSITITHIYELWVRVLWSYLSRRLCVLHKRTFEVREFLLLLFKGVICRCNRNAWNRSCSFERNSKTKKLNISILLFTLPMDSILFLSPPLIKNKHS